MNVRRIALAAAAFLGAASTPLAAQSAQPWSLVASGLATELKYPGFTNRGFGGEAQIRRTWVNKWSLGLGVQYSVHKEDFGGGDTFTDKPLGVFAEPRYAIDLGSDRFAPYLAGRVAYLTWEEEATFGGVPQTFDRSTGYAYGAGAGMMIRLGATTNLDIGVIGLRNTIEFGSVGETLDFWNYAAKVGLSFGFGKR